LGRVIRIPGSERGKGIWEKEGRGICDAQTKGGLLSPAGSQKRGIRFVAWVAEEAGGDRDHGKRKRVHNQGTLTKQGLRKPKN